MYVINIQKTKNGRYFADDILNKKYTLIQI